jgi:hypothetical protein
VWVSFYDLPDATRDALWKKHQSKLAFPAELPLAVKEPSTMGKLTQCYYYFLEAVSGGRVYQARWMQGLGIPPVPQWTVLWALKLVGK